MTARPVTAALSVVVVEANLAVPRCCFSTFLKQNTTNNQSFDKTATATRASFQGYGF